MIKQLCIFPVLIFCFTHAKAQQPQADSLPGRDEAIEVFHRNAGLQSQLYNGRTHLLYPSNMLGSAYFGSNDPQTGMVEYDHIVFKDVPLWYDEVRDKVVVQHFNKISAFELISEHVATFAVGSHPFIRIVRVTDNQDNAPSTGFYEVLCSGKLTILARRKKLVSEYIENMELKTRIDNKESFYAKKDGVYYSVNNERSLLGVIKDKRSEVQQYLRKNKLKFRKTPDATLVQAAVYYNQLTH